MVRVKVNVLANFAGVGWSAIMQIVFVPVYVKLMGIEAYGLVGLYVMVQAACQILDLGISPTMNREMARYSAQPEKATEARDFVRTLEIGYWLIGVIIGAMLMAGAPLIASHWIKADTIPVSDVKDAVMIMGLLTALQWPLSFYQGGLMGLQRQLLLNSIKVVMITLSSGGAALILWLVSPTIEAFFKWHMIISLVQVTTTTVVLWRSLPPSHRAPRVDPTAIRRVWRFAAGMSGIVLTATALTQLDKVILSKLLSLEMFGYYALAGVIGNGLYVLIGPIFNAIFPRFSVLVAAHDDKGLKNLYHCGTQLMAVLTIPVAAVLALFPFDVLGIWTGSPEIAQNAAPIVRLLVIGTALNGLMNLPYALQLANGWTSIGLRINTLLIIVLVPGIFVAATQYGAVGAAGMWVVLNVIYMFIGIPITHAKLLKGESWSWLSRDVGGPLVAALSVVSIGRWLISSSMAPIAMLGSLALVLVAALIAALLAAPEIRARFVMSLGRPSRVEIVIDRII